VTLIISPQDFLMRQPSVIPQSSVIIFHLDHLQLIDQQGVTLVIRGKWFTLYRELFLGGSGELDRLSVSGLPGWTITEDDIGRELARHLRRSKASKLDPPPILSQHPTLSWQRNPVWSVAMSHECQEAEPSGLGRRDWMPALCGGTEVATVRWALLQIKALLAFIEGSLRTTVDLALAAAKDAHCEDLRAASQLLALRAAWRIEPDDAVLNLAEDLEDAISTLPPSSEANPLRAVVLARLTAFKTLHAVSDEWPNVIRSLNQRLAGQRTGGDLMTDALTANYLAVTLRRSGDVATAFTMIAKALAAAVVSGDMQFIQGVLFNCGHIMLEAGSLPGRDSLIEHAIQALELVSTITEQHNIGGDSAQNELLIADHKMAQHKFEDAERLLERARRLIDKNSNVYDQACLGEGVLRLEWVRDPSFGATSSFRVRIDEVAELYVLANREDLASAARKSFGVPSASRKRQ
jgi:hypothetical protein